MQPFLGPAHHTEHRAKSWRRVREVTKIVCSASWLGITREASRLGLRILSIPLVATLDWWVSHKRRKVA